MSNSIEKLIQRNPHPDFKKVEESRPEFESDIKFHYTKTPHPEWTPGSGATTDEWKAHKKLEIDPYGEGRNPILNYKLLISGIVPRPIGLISSISAAGVKNLSPFSYTTVVNHDPPIFCIGLSCGSGNFKDTCKNILQTKELTINVISEFFIEAANYTSTNAPEDVSEWDLSGLTEAPSTKVKPSHVAESIFSVEAKLLYTHEWFSKSTGKQTGTLCICEGVNFHVREDAMNADHSIIDCAVLQPVARQGGITYTRATQGFELLRPDYDTEKEKPEIQAALKRNA
ncbi:hypothetical protein CANCADRAFT_25366 [Tortispora caseinolytica NRRL Y-17796]|uniref:Flavin reductase like domain-containing protein n=1 Tax=Tortispora caseinolytica NRRL Y-17796 TaxID=767744 RepID=A0A1E4THT7_9ASCO|nr:hypothetical protein CANCADRAFT_25366 [Tortispora caseinolytica NRRL Y-17796]